MDTLFSDPTANTNYEPDQYRTIFTTQNLRPFFKDLYVLRLVSYRGPYELTQFYGRVVL